MPRVRRRELRQQVLEALRAHLEDASQEVFVPEDAHHAADLADVMWLDLEPDEAREVFHSLDLAAAAQVLAEAEEKLQRLLLEGADPEFVGQLLSELSYDDGTDLLEVLPEELRLEVMCFVTPEDAAELRHLSEYNPDSAGGMMTTEFLTASMYENVGDLLKRIKRDEGESESIYVAFIVDEIGILNGVISTRELLEAGIHELVADIMIPDVILAKVDEDREDVAHRILHYNLSVIPVVDPRGVIVGVATADDALEVLEEEGSEDALLLAGAHGESDAGEPLLTMVGHRAPMLGIPILAGLLMAKIMVLFESKPAPSEGLDSFKLCVRYVPMVLALSGTVGMQTSAVLVRGFAVGQIVSGRRFGVFLSEVKVGIALGALCALVTAPTIGWLLSDMGDGMVLAMALMVSIGWSATVSSSIALGSEAAGLDPALVSGPLMIAVSDLSAVVLFLGMASALIS
ncbi:MAG: magnesium transporter [Planctomycetota bacterium]|jgi:magnesium transporter|nr:magnesium transporter [Planctomycetota bacterium]